MGKESLEGFWLIFMVGPLLGGLLAGLFSKAHSWFINNYNMFDKPVEDEKEEEDAPKESAPAAAAAADE